jgi:uroporphyrinogen-III synthase
VTRTREQAEHLVDRLHAAGASVVVVPLITTVPVADPDAILQAAAALGAAAAPHWVAFTSATAVRLVLGAVGIEALADLLVAVVGPATAAALETAGRAPDLVAADHDAAGLSTAMLDRGVAGASVWFPAAEGASGEFARALRAGGATVTEQVIYRSAMPVSAPERLRAAFDGGIDAIMLTSGSTARHLVEAVGVEGIPAGASVVCLGQQTAIEARRQGLAVAAVARVASIDALVDALTECLARQPLR